MKYLEILSSLTSLLLLITSGYVSIRNIKIINRQKYFTLYILCLLSFSDSLIYWTTVNIFKEVETYILISEISHNIFIPFEIAAFLYFYIVSKNQNEVLSFRNNIIIILFYLLLTFIAFYDNKLTYILALIEIATIYYFSLRYYQSIILGQEKLNIDDKLINSIFIFGNLTTPYYILSQFLKEESYEILSKLSFINNIGYIYLFIYFNIAFKWILENRKF